MMEWKTDMGALMARPDPSTQYIIVDGVLSVIYTECEELKGDEFNAFNR